MFGFRSARSAPDSDDEIMLTTTTATETGSTSNHTLRPVAGTTTGANTYASIGNTTGNPSTQPLLLLQGNHNHEDEEMHTDEYDPQFDPFSSAHETKALLSLGGMIGVSYLFLFFTPLCCTAFIGYSRSLAELQGFGLAAMIVDFLGFAPITGLACGLDTLIPQAYGITPRHPMICVFVQRAFLFLLVYCVPVALLFWFSEPILLYFGTGTPEVVSIAAKNLRVMILLLPSWVGSEVLQCYLNGLGKSFELFTGTAVGACCCPILLYVFVSCDRVGFYGGACAWVIAQFAIPFTTYLLARFRHCFDETWFGWSRRAFTDWWHFLRLALPALGMMLCEWSAFEINGIVASRFLEPEAFTAVVILNQLLMFMLAVPMGIMTAVSVRIGQFAGQGLGSEAQKIAVIGQSVMTVLTLCSAAVLISSAHWLPVIFIDDFKVLKAYEDLVWAGAALYILDILFTYSCFLLRALGYQVNGTLISVGAWWAIGLPCGWILASQTMLSTHHDNTAPNAGAKSLYIGPTIGLAAGYLVAAAYIFSRRGADWKERRGNQMTDARLEAMLEYGTFGN